MQGPVSTADVDDPGMIVEPDCLRILLSVYGISSGIEVCQSPLSDHTVHDGPADGGMAEQDLQSPGSVEVLLRNDLHKRAVRTNLKTRMVHKNRPEYGIYGDKENQ